jgi:Uri superfamily endonuclease
MASEATWATSAEALPAVPGAYALLVAVAEPVPLPPRLAATLSAGRYLYVGSARGPGGIRARCARHLRRPKPRRWHVDWLTENAPEIAALALPGGDECGLVDVLRCRPGFSLPVAGFGSSDCRRCPAHLVRLGPGHDAAVLERLLAGTTGP